MPISLSRPELQVGFAASLMKLRETYLQDALFATVKTLNIGQVDSQLVGLAPSDDLALLASKGLRGEMVFATPAALAANPRLLGYYRLLLGFSQKEFYKAGTGLGMFRSMEEKGTLSERCHNAMEDLCRGLNAAASYLIREVSEVALAHQFLDDLTLLTLGPQLRGAANVVLGNRAIMQVFEGIRAIVESHIAFTSSTSLVVRNAARRDVLIEFAADPDIIIRERLSKKSSGFRNIIAIEVKGGKDFSNIHNRIGEAEKSHQKAKARGFTECWTILNVDRFSRENARVESPTTNRFYLLSSILADTGEEYESFRERILALAGLPNRSRRRTK